MSRSEQSRRRFLHNSLAIAGAGFAIGGTRTTGRVIGANDTIRVAVAGVNGRGMEHIDQFSKAAGVELVYLVDPDERTYEKALHGVKSSGRAPKTVRDIRRVLDDKDVDAVSIATPNHWHSLMTIWACQAGKDVYVEKPCSHNVHEGQVAVEAARKYNRIVQHGTQGRSERHWAEAAALIRSGKLGKLHVSRALCYKPRKSIGEKPTTTPPSELDFNLWLGPAQEQAYHANLVPYNWHWFWDFGNGDIGNQGVHQMDVARWLIPGPDGSKSATLPKSVLSVGGRFGYHDQGQTANTQVSVMDFGDAQLIFEVRGLPTKKFEGELVGNIAHLDEGTLVGDTFHPKGGKEAVPVSKLAAGLDVPRRPGKNHFDNFLEAVRSRKVENLNADILEGHHSSALCHLANISYRLGAEVPFSKETKAFGDDKDAFETFARMEDHLKEDGVKLENLNYRLGRKLTVDAASASFVDAPEANRLLTRAYRAPFVVPDRIA
ncbi:Gfo/Idh/MocA family protein [Paludisphaera borealis]|uniref:Uncharacterized protein n=1 Tax=Paludisphaera borealis TaxID=1387353 RepID=A0A1U7CIY5_9BACT|nr:Gfo/Idh/MocA family oxidoreductase [Paludisphaera borealis]APW58867.1 putative Rossmann-fold-type glycoside hydrolase of unknown function [Paludisphaera borealis]